MQLDKRITYSLSYIFSLIGGILLLITNKENNIETKYVAVQSIMLGIIGLIARVAFSMLWWVPIIGIVFNIAYWVFGIVLFIVICVSAYKAFNGYHYKIPYLSDFISNYTKFTIPDDGKIVMDTDIQ